MATTKLQQARAYEKENMSTVPSSERPCYHVTGPVGWINDPNGFSEYDGFYHLFFQYHPYSVKWGPMHWGHARSRDLITWEYLPAALAPDEEYDRDGCYSGSAITLDDGRHLLIYTAVKKEDKDGSAREFQQQAIAVGDGINYTKSFANPVIGTSMIPQGNSTSDFRDPKVFRENGRYYAVVGSRDKDGFGEALLYESPDCVNWQFVTIVDKSGGKFGKMWECPDYFELNGRRILMASPQELTGDEGFYPGSISVFFIGSAGADLSLNREAIQLIDEGPDFYAPQTMLAGDGRRLMIGWMQNWETSDTQSAGRKIFGQMTVPRELEYKNGRVYQNPVREIETYRKGKIICRGATVCGETYLEGINGRIIDLAVTIDFSKNTGLCDFRIELARDDEHSTKMCYDPQNSMVTIDRSRSGCPENPTNIRKFKVEPQRSILKIRMLLDKNSIEFFFNDGQMAASISIYTPLSADAICFYAESEIKMDIEKYGLLSPSTVNLDDLAGKIVC